jgi:hypothetical protein
LISFPFGVRRSLPNASFIDLPLSFDPDSDFEFDIDAPTSEVRIRYPVASTALFGRHFELMQYDRKALGEMREIPVTCKNAQVASYGCGANQKVSVGPLNSL